LNLHPKAKVMGDPMAGCGTVAVEVAALGKSGLFSDVDPLACLLTRVKSTPLDPEKLVSAVEAIIREWQPTERPGIRRPEARREIEDLEKSTRFRAPPNVFHWFLPYVAVNICRFLRGVERIRATRQEEEALLAILAGTVRRVSKADPNTASGLEVTSIRKKELASGLQFDIVKELRRRTRVVAKGYRELLKVSNQSHVVVVQGDARQWSDICERSGLFPDLVITSPCYMSAIEYWRRHKLEYCWLGLVNPTDIASIRRRFLGMGEEDPNISDLSPYLLRIYKTLNGSGFRTQALDFVRYFNDSLLWLAEVSKVISESEGTAYVVVGTNKTRGTYVDTARGLQELASEVGLRTKVVLRYALANYYMQYPTRDNIRIRQETVLRFVPN